MPDLSPLVQDLRCRNLLLRAHHGAAGLLTLALAVTLALTACGGDGDSDLPTVAEVAPELAEFGDLATVHSQPVSETFGPDGGSMDLADGSRVDVPEGAFTEPTELTVAIVDVEVEDPVKELRVYHLSTVEDVGPLGAPVVLEGQRPAGEVAAAELVDGQWQLIQVPPGTATRVSIDQFSSVYLAWLACVGSFTRQISDDLYADELARIVIIWCGGLPDLPDEPDEPDGQPEPALSPADQRWITYVVDDTRSELERAGAPDEEIAGGQGAVRVCLTNALERGDSREAALDACESAAAPYFPTPTATQTPEAEPEPEPEPTTQPSVAFLEGPTGQIVKGESGFCGSPPGCDWRISLTVGYSNLAGPGFIVCSTNGTYLPTEPQSVSPGSGNVPVTWERTGFVSWVYPSVTCYLRTADGDPLATTVATKVFVP